MYGGTSTAVTVSLNHSSFWVQFFKPQASTASLSSKQLHLISSIALIEIKGTAESGYILFNIGVKVSLATSKLLGFSLHV